MTQSVLGSVTLGYELIWNQKRRCCAVRLFVEADSHSAPDARHLIAAITELWPESAPTLLLNVRSPSLLNGLLDHTPVRGVWMEIQDHWLSDELFAGRVRKAHQRGLPMVWSGEPGQVPAADVETWFHKTLRVLPGRSARLPAPAAGRRRGRPPDGAQPRAGGLPVRRSGQPGAG
jgi:EAL and modified HD-GYP domain-containing signal transduction protein